MVGMLVPDQNSSSKRTRLQPGFCFLAHSLSRKKNARREYRKFSSLPAGGRSLLCAEALSVRPTDLRKRYSFAGQKASQRVEMKVEKEVR
jgi:hypothetical protein